MVSVSEMARATPKVHARDSPPVRAKAPATVSESVTLERMVSEPAREGENARAKEFAREPEFVTDYQSLPAQPALAPLHARVRCSAQKVSANAMAGAFVLKKAIRVSAVVKVFALVLENAQGLVPALVWRSARAYLPSFERRATPSCC